MLFFMKGTYLYFYAIRFFIARYATDIFFFQDSDNWKDPKFKREEK